MYTKKRTNTIHDFTNNIVRFHELVNFILDKFFVSKQHLRLPMIIVIKKYQICHKMVQRIREGEKEKCIILSRKKNILKIHFLKV